jgi:hypothetical protein
MQVSLSAGTPEMPELDKTYQIGVTATDFFGSVSKEVTVSVFKVALPPDQTPTPYR